MRFRALVPLVSLLCTSGVVALGCRGIVGIDDLTLADAGSDGGASDGGSTDAAAMDGPAPMPDAAGGDASTCGSKSNRGDCEMCCGMEQPVAFGAFQGFADQQDTCVCTECTNCSAMKVCGGTTSAMMSMCLGCIINTMIDSACTGAGDPQAKCSNDSTCRPYQTCVAACRPLP